MIVPRVKFFVHWRIRTLIEMRLGPAASESKSFQTDAKITAEEKLRIQTPAPGVVAAKKPIVFTEDAEIVGNLDFRAIAFGSGKGVGTPDRDVEFPIGIKFFTTLWNDGLFHFLTGILGAGVTNCGECASGDDGDERQFFHKGRIYKPLAARVNPKTVRRGPPAGPGQLLPMEVVKAVEVHGFTASMPASSGVQCAASGPVGLPTFFSRSTNGAHNRHITAKNRKL